MIRVNYKKDNLIKEIKISGHANFADYGKDIVCAAVSTLVTTTINNILTLNNEAIEYKDSGEYILITNKDNEIADKLLNNMLNMLSELAEDYPNNIKIGG